MGGLVEGCGTATVSYSKAPQVVFISLPALCRGLLLRVSWGPLRALPQLVSNTGKHFYALPVCQTLFYTLLPFISHFILTTAL